MIQALSSMRFYESLNYTFEKGVYQNYNTARYPILVDRTKLKPFQIKRSYIADAISVFELLDCEGNQSVDLMDDVGLFDTYRFTNGYKFFVWTGAEDITTTIPKGVYNIKISDGTNTYYSNPVYMDDLNLDIYGFGSFSNGFSNGFEIEGGEITEGSTNFVINLINYHDKDSEIYQFGFQHIDCVDERHAAEYYFLDAKEKRNIDDSTGKDIINSIYHLKSHNLSFNHNIDMAKFMLHSEVMNKMTILTDVGDEIEPIQWEVNINKLDEIYYNITITFDNYFINKNSCNSDYATI